MVLLLGLAATISCTESDTPQVKEELKLNKISFLEGQLEFSYDTKGRLTSISSTNIEERDNYNLSLIWLEGKVTGVTDDHDARGGYSISYGDDDLISTIELGYNSSAGRVTQSYHFTYNDSKKMTQVIYMETANGTGEKTDKYTFSYMDQNLKKSLHYSKEGIGYVENYHSMHSNFDNQKNLTEPLIKSLDDQPALAYFILWRQLPLRGLEALALSKNNPGREDALSTNVYNYTYNELGYVTEVSASLGGMNPLVIANFSYK